MWHCLLLILFIYIYILVFQSLLYLINKAVRVHKDRRTINQNRRAAHEIKRLYTCAHCGQSIEMQHLFSVEKRIICLQPVRENNPHPPPLLMLLTLKTLPWITDQYLVTGTPPCACFFFFFFFFLFFYLFFLQLWNCKKPFLSGCRKNLKPTMVPEKQSYHSLSKKQSTKGFQSTVTNWNWERISHRWDCHVYINFFIYMFVFRHYSHDFNSWQSESTLPVRWS